MVTVGEIKEKMHTKIWGERSFTIGEAIGLGAAILIMLFGRRFLGKWTAWVAIIVIAVSMIFN